MGSGRRGLSGGRGGVSASVPAFALLFCLLQLSVGCWSGMSRDYAPMVAYYYSIRSGDFHPS